MSEKKEKSEKIPLSKKFFEVYRVVKGEISLTDKTYGQIRKRIIHSARILFASIEKFIEDDCLTKASSIAYTTIMSLIPMLAVALTFMSFGAKTNKEQIFAYIQKILADYNLSRLNIDPYVDAISNLLDNAASIGGIGMIVLVFSATAVLNTLEHSLNTIWGAKRQRSVILRMIYYWAVLTLGPLMLIAGTTAAAQISTIFSAANYNAVYASADGSAWAAGNKGTIRNTSPDSTSFQLVSIDQIDFDNQRIYKFDTASKTFYKDEAVLDETEILKSDFTGIQFVRENGWAVGKNGIILSTTNNGLKWRIDRWGSFHLKDIRMLDESRGFIATSEGYMLRTKDGGSSWEIMSWPSINGPINKIDFYGKTGIAVCNRGYILKTTDSGNTWTPILMDQSRNKKKNVNLNGISMYDENHAWIACDDGIIITTSDGFATASAKRFRTNNYSTVLLISPREGYAAGEDGIFISSKDGGTTWQRQSIHTGTVNSITAIGDRIWASGSAGLLIHSNGKHTEWKGETGTGFIIALLNFFGPFVFIWLSFLLVYQLLPNMRIPFKPAAIGAAITGAIWVGFILGFIVYVKSFANGTFAVYGALAAFPIFLLLIYSSAVIILFGAEVSYMIVYLDTHLHRKRMRASVNEIPVYSGIRVLHAIFQKFEKDGGATEAETLVKLCDNPRETEYFLTIFRDAKLILDREGGGILPATSSDNVRLSDVLAMIHDASLMIPGNAPNDILKKKLGDLFSQMSASRKDILGDMRLSAVIRG